MDDRELLVRRSASQLLDRRFDRDPVAIVEGLLAVQAQDRGAWRLALRARGSGFSAADVDRALTQERSLLVAWLNRGTLHLVTARDYPWLIALTAPTQAAGNARRLAQLGLTPGEVDRAVALIERALADDGPLPRAELRSRLAADGIRTDGQASVHLLFASVIRGVAVMGPMIGKEHAFAAVRDWLGLEQDPLAPLSAERRQVALAELARRYLRGHGPATDGDLAKWAGLPLRDARAGLRSIADEVIEIAGPAGPLLDLAARWAARGAARGAAAPPAGRPPIRPRRCRPGSCRASTRACSAGRGASRSSRRPMSRASCRPAVASFSRRRP